MKKIVIILGCIFLLTLFTGCVSENQDEESDKSQIEKISDFVHVIGKNQLTEDESLTGERSLVEKEDYFTGTYVMEAEQLTKREVLFGGATIEERNIKCNGVVQSISGKADIRIRMNEEVIYLEPDEDGNFIMDLSFESGGNYIMIDYENFTGSIELRCTEGKDRNEE